MTDTFKQFLMDEDGPAAVEYAVMLMLILMVCIGAIQVISIWFATSTTSTANEIGDYMT